ncbi:MAG: hypothetical protein A2Y17_07025 [Clostridiales bacterium GWF2_38_85]|nr:MAG: hypothetical protein A2Y17_07025 [Clostridiales bacterium GWF2_38_85]HBL84970.1 protease modulator HflC [Clostridiales bacterium]
MKKFIFLIIIGVILLFSIIVFFSSIYIVREDQYACVLRFSKIEKVVSEAGLQFKTPFIDNVKYYSKKVLIYDIEPSSVFTKDKMAMTVDFYIAWEIADPLTFYSTIGSIENAKSRLDSITYNNVKNLMGTLNQNDIINEDDPSLRNEIYKQITDNVAKASQVYGITIKDVKIKRFDLPTENENSVYERMISERNKLAATIIAEAEKDATKIKTEADRAYNVMISDAELTAKLTIAEGEQEYMSILAQTFDTQEKQDFYQFIRSLEVLKASLNGNDKTVILSKDSELAKLLIGLD